MNIIWTLVFWFLDLHRSNSLLSSINPRAYNLFRSFPNSPMSPASSGPLLLGQLLSSSLAFVRSCWKPILIGAVIFGTAGGVVAGTVAGGAAFGMKGVVNDMGIDVEKMEELSMRLKNGDDTAMAEMEALLDENVGAMGDEAQAMMAGKMLAVFAPFIGVAAVLGILIAVLSHAYFLLLALSPKADAMTILKKTPALFFPLLGLWIWMFLRSFTWIPIPILLIPVIGLPLSSISTIPAFIIGIILAPRFALSPVIMLKQKKGIMESVRLSYDGTKGYWGKIVGNMIVAALCVMLAGIVAGIIVGILGFMAPMLGVWLNAIVKEVLSAFTVVFAVQLATTLLSNPMTAVPAKAKKKK